MTSSKNNKESSHEQATTAGKTSSETDTTPNINADRELAQKLYEEFKAKYALLLQEPGIDHIQFARMGFIALTTLTAAIAVDVLMTEEQFMDVCRFQFQEAFKRAPKFA